MKRLGHAIRRRCPRCGSRAFRSYYELHQRCPGCGLAFEREPGYWVGAMIVITSATFGMFLLVLVGGVVVTWPDPPWIGLLVVTMIVNATIPVATYPQAKLTWAAMELGWHPLEEKEIAEAQAFLDFTSASPPHRA